MTTATITGLELLRTRVSGAVGGQMPQHLERLGWDAGRLAACQRDRLRALLARAIAGSPFHARRLRGVDPDRFELADLARLPVMTKADMMEKVLVTNLHNLTQPLIRYELTDRFTPAGTSEGGALRASVQGRSDDLFRYAGASVHPFVIGAPLLHAPAVREFQVRQTESGADIAAVTDGDFDPSAVVAAVARSLRQAGVSGPQVGFRRVVALDRDPMTSKVRRFVPLPAVTLER